MLRAKSLSGIEFTHNTLFIQEEFEKDNIMSEMYMSAAGTHIVYEAPINTPYITLDSKEHGYILDDQKDLLEAMWVNIGTTYVLEFDDLSTINVRFAREKKMTFNPLFEGSKKYRAIIPLAKI